MRYEQFFLRLSKSGLGALAERTLGLLVIGVAIATFPVTAQVPEAEERKWLDESRVRLQEPRFDASGAPSEAYRAIWVPTFSHPTAVRLQHDGSRWVVVISRLSGEGGYEMGRLKSKKTRRVRESDVAKIRQLIAEMGLLKSPSLGDPENVCVDGTTWGYEVVAKGEYHAFSRHCPRQPPEDRFCELGRALLKLAKVDPDEVE